MGDNLKINIFEEAINNNSCYKVSKGCIKDFMIRMKTEKKKKKKKNKKKKKKKKK
jgi:hypothetical protein